jgi:hypothetical protein
LAAAATFILCAITGIIRSRQSVNKIPIRFIWLDDFNF